MELPLQMVHIKMLIC